MDCGLAAPRSTPAQPCPDRKEGCGAQPTRKGKEPRYVVLTLDFGLGIVDWRRALLHSGPDQPREANRAPTVRKGTALNPYEGQRAVTIRALPKQHQTPTAYAQVPRPACRFAPGAVFRKRGALGALRAAELQFHRTSRPADSDVHRPKNVPTEQRWDVSIVRRELRD